MDDIEVEAVAEADLTDPVFIEGLPGVGNVGKLAVEHLLEEFEEATLVRRIYADVFPPQVSLDDGVAELTHAEVHAVETPGDGPDLLLLTGDHQAQSNEGHYHLTDAFLDVAEEFGAERLFALGGVPTGELVDEPSVLGGVTDESMRETLEDAGVEFREDEPAGGIVGVSGLLLGLGGRRGFEAACLMGETSGYLVDPQSAQAVIEVLQDLLEFSVDFEALEDRAEEMKEVAAKIQEMQQQQQQNLPSDDDLRYIG
ncbi:MULTISPECIES: proteasome assembly chaperone family protein [Haloferax]|uniref:Proteasome assembly chaperone family protein n=1 Tax=Haloferax marinum TaxID=2666143 RepID=A0A6A8G4G2_9EURY|nr:MULTISPECIES: proteasome assembly chaperone family protein [Haloferax]KAB1198913.1 proteasome assembly chaperone family protein [Haloferax sp. CBA1150]MRW96104.1 proteasome assembly chaperone family protein [Haloferax marinum]